MDCGTEYVSHFNTVDINDIISNKRILANYQPIISVIKKTIVGFEGLSRGVNRWTGSVIAPVKMFEYAQKKGMTIELDRVCRDKCLQGFKDIISINSNVHLFINIDASIIEHVEGSNYLLKQVMDNKIDPRNIVIEINESKVHDVAPLIKFVNNYRNKGFLIALDDVGAGFSNFDRISLLRPDIVKLDKSLVSGIEKSHYKQEIFKCLVSLANKVGAIVVAEGIETQEEVNLTLEYGAHLLQGYYFSKPDFIDSKHISGLNVRINDTAVNWKNYMKIKMKSEKDYKRLIDSVICGVVSELEKIELQQFNNVISKFVIDGEYLNIECAYILDESGIQITDTIFNIKKEKARKGLMFYPAAIGADNSLNRYYYELINFRMSKYVSDPYISHATGNVCITVSTVFRTIRDKRYVLCVDIISNSNLNNQKVQRIYNEP